MTSLTVSSPLAPIVLSVFLWLIDFSVPTLIDLFVALWAKFLTYDTIVKPKKTEIHGIPLSPLGSLFALKPSWQYVEKYEYNNASVNEPVGVSAIKECILRDHHENRCRDEDENDSPNKTYH
jgi:hypothetical protein